MIINCAANNHQFHHVKSDNDGSSNRSPATDILSFTTLQLLLHAEYETQTHFRSTRRCSRIIRW